MPESISRRRSLRKRLMWAFMLLTTFALIAQATALFLASEEQEEDLIDEVISTTLEQLIAHPRDQLPSALGRHLTLYHAPVGTIPKGLPEAVAKLPIGMHEWFSRGTEFHVGIRDHAGERYYLLYDATDHEERLVWLFWALLVGVMSFSLLSLWLGHWLAKVLVRQLEQVATNLKEENQDPQSSPLTRPEQDREVALLAMALDDYRARNAALIAREREFTANVSHELRTPLTRIRTGAELLASGMNDVTKAERIVLAVDELERRLKGLLFLARTSFEPENQPVLLHALVENLAEHYVETCASRGVVVNNRIPTEISIVADPTLLSLLIDNLLRNAVKYTYSGSIDLDFQENWLILRDTGVGIAEDHQEQVFERHFRADGMQDGTGLGLHIVREICDRCGWVCKLQSKLGEGTEIQVKLG